MGRPWLKAHMVPIFPKKDKKKSKWQVETNWETFGVLVCKLCSLRGFIKKLNRKSHCQCYFRAPWGPDELLQDYCLSCSWKQFFMTNDSILGFLVSCCKMKVELDIHLPEGHYIMDTDLKITGFLNTMLELERNSIFGAASDCWDFLFNIIAPRRVLQIGTT